MRRRTYRYAFVRCEPCKRSFEVGRSLAKEVTVKDKCPRCGMAYIVKLDRVQK